MSDAWWITEAKKVKCPHCGAEPTKPCKTVPGSHPTLTHVARLNAVGLSWGGAPYEGPTVVR